jgi:hypothetical protein
MKRSWKRISIFIFLIAVSFFTTAAGQSRSQAVATATLTVIPCLSIEVVKAESSVKGVEASVYRMNVKGTGSVLVVMGSKGNGTSNEIHLTQERSATVSIPTSQLTSKTSIAYLSS